MHHDVRVPMMLPDPSGSSLHMYANPLRTVYHRCEVPVSSTVAVSTPASNHHQQRQQPCPYHSCCAPFTERRLCTAALEVARRDDGDTCDIEPEECERFVLEHRHHRLERLGMGVSLLQEQRPQQGVATEAQLLQSPSASSNPSLSSSSSSSLSLLTSSSSSTSYDPEVDYQRCFPSQHLDKSPDHHYHPTENYGVQGERERGITVITTMTTTWRDDLEGLQWRDDHGNPSSGAIGGLAPLTGAGSVFAHQGRYRGPWEEQLFLAAERLYLLVSDAATHYAVLRDLSVMTAVVPPSRNVFLSSSPRSVPAAGIVNVRDRCCWEAMAQASSAAVAAAVNYVRVRETLQAHRVVVERMLRWAGVPCLQC